MQQVTAKQLRIASRKVWASIPIGMRFVIAFQRIIASIQDGIAGGIVAILAQHGYDVPLKANGKPDMKDPEVRKLGKDIYYRVQNRLRGRPESDIHDVMMSTYEVVFLRPRKTTGTPPITDLRGKTFKENRAWILRVFDNAAVTQIRTLNRQTKKEIRTDLGGKGGDPDSAVSDERLKAEMVRSQLTNERINWERHPIWIRIEKDIKKELQKFDSKTPRMKYEFPTVRMFDLIFREGLSMGETAKQLVEEGGEFGVPANQLRHAVKRFRNRLREVIDATMTEIKKDPEMLDSFYEAISR